MTTNALKLFKISYIFNKDTFIEFSFFCEIVQQIYKNTAFIIKANKTKFKTFIGFIKFALLI